MREHPIEPVLVNDLLRLLGREVKRPQKRTTVVSQPLKPKPQPTTKPAQQTTKTVLAHKESFYTQDVKKWAIGGVLALLLVGLIVIIANTIASGTEEPSAEVTTTEIAKIEEVTSIPAGYVDLGLPSGTLWKDENEPCGLITYDEAVKKYGDRLPTKTQCEELRDKCTWTRMGSGMNVTGSNGNSIVLPAEGHRWCGGSVDDVGSNGYYWSATANGSDDAWDLGFGSGGAYMDYNYRCNGISVRLVQDK